MIEWKKIQLSDKEFFDNNKGNTEGIAMFGFASMYLWREYFQTSFAVINGNIVARGDSDDGETVIYFPRGLEYDVEKTISENLRSTLGIGPKVTLVNPKSIVRSEGKAKRIIDLRKLS